VPISIFAVVCFLKAESANKKGQLKNSSEMTTIKIHSIISFCLVFSLTIHLPAVGDPASAGGLD